MHSEAERLAHIIEELLDVARIDEGRIELQRQPFGLEPIVAHTLATLRTSDPAFQLEWRRRFAC